MKKRIVLLLIILLITTGCTCRYNLTITNNVYKESISITAENSTEITNLNQKWQIPVDKEEYDVGTDPSTKTIPVTNTYNYNFSGSNLKLNYDFTKNTYVNSTAVFNCYKTLNIENYASSIIISTSKSATCFEKYPTLTKLVVTVNVDKKVTSHNADSVSGSTYTWNINRDNYTNKAINLVLENNDNDSKVTKPEEISTNPKKDYTMYIFAGILLIVMLAAYVIINGIKNKEDVMDD